MQYRVIDRVVNGSDRSITNALREVWHRKRDFYGFGGWRFVVDMRKTEASHGDIRSSAMARDRARSAEVSRGCGAE